MWGAAVPHCVLSQTCVGFQSPKFDILCVARTHTVCPVSALLLSPVESVLFALLPPASWEREGPHRVACSSVRALGKHQEETCDRVFFHFSPGTHIHGDIAVCTGCIWAGPKKPRSMPGLVVDSGLDAFSQYPSRGSVTTLAARPIVETRDVA